MINILEIRTQALEDIFNLRSKEIVQQKARAEELVYNILPRSGLPILPLNLML